MPSTINEIELKVLLTKDQYDSLISRLPSMMKLTEEDSIHTTKYRPKDIRLRHSKKMFEIVYKDGDPTSLSRKEITIPLSSKEHIDSMADLLSEIGFYPEPSWVKHKKEFEYEFEGYIYTLSLQHIENFARILEVEHIAENEDDNDLHEKNIRKIISDLGLEPIDPEGFKEKISEYIQKFSNGST